MLWRRLFLDHPQQIGETYWQHARQALLIGLRLLGATIACIVHALIPGLFTHSASQSIIKLAEQLQARQRDADHN